MFRALLVGLLLAAEGKAGSIVIDDFIDPAVVVNEGEVVTLGVGDLDATRRLQGFEPAMDVFPIARLEIADGRYVVNVDDAGEVFFAYSYYEFPTTDFSQFDSIILDIADWPDPSTDPMIPSIPGLMVVAEVDEGLPSTTLLVREIIRGVGPGRLVLPFDTFTNRGGGAINPAFWSSINQLWVQVGAHRDWGPWKVRFDRFAVSNAVPEPTSFACMAIGFVSWSFLFHRLRRRKHVLESCFGGAVGPGNMPVD